ncbi:hypothetical protein [Paenibacillus sp. DYY-L-2]|uniref:hypothetical protein n=1 Tax=Paenibacillus sp. DYY-L-2 TaxID=3447013 RepID=UPI003F50C8E4
MLQNKKLIWIAAAAVVLVIVLLAVFIPKGKDQAAENASATPDTTKVSEAGNAQNAKVAGTWYSDREDNDILTLSEDGSYSSTGWLTSGKYIVEGDLVSLTDPFGTTKELTLKDGEGGKVLFYENEPLSHTYFQSEQLAKQSQEAQKPEELPLGELEEVVKEMTLGDWESEYQPQVLSITEDQIAHQFKDKDGKVRDDLTQYYSYKIVEVTQSDSKYYELGFHVNLEITRLDDNYTYTADMSIQKDREGSYAISSGYAPLQGNFIKISATE